MDAGARDRVLEGLELLLSCEAAVGEFYRCCAQTWHIDRAFWLGLAGDEAIHAARLGLLLERVREGAATARLARAFPGAALSALLQGAIQNRELLVAGKVGRAMALVLARNLERALIASRALQAVSFEQGGWDGYLRTIAAETHRHERVLEERLGQERQRDGSGSHGA
jgi:hypothetical protein